MQKAWGNGYATETASETFEYGFNTLNLNLITGRAHIENLASIKVLEKIGMNFIAKEIVDDCLVKTFTKANPAL
jgi:RimJ/RimL family protein N-acetyltransferase